MKNKVYFKIKNVKYTYDFNFEIYIACFEYFEIDSSGLIPLEYREADAR